MNKIILSGRFVSDPEIYETPKQKKLAKFRLAVKRNFKNANGDYDTDFFSCIAFGNAENIKQYCHKGDQVLVEGRVQNRTYEDDKKEKHYITEIMCDNVEFLYGKNNSSSEEKHTTIEPKEQETYDNEQVFADFGDSIEISDDDIAF